MQLGPGQRAGMGWGGVRGRDREISAVQLMGGLAAGPPPIATVEFNPLPGAGLYGACGEKVKVERRRNSYGSPEPLDVGANRHERKLIRRKSCRGHRTLQFCGV